MSTPPKLDDDSCGSQRTFSSKSFVRKSFDEVQKEKASHQKAACDVTASENQHARRRRTFELMRHSDLGGTQRLLKGALDQHLTPKEKMDTVLTRGKQQGWNAAKFFRFFDANDDGTLSKTDFVEGFQCLDPHVHFDDSDLNEIIGLFQTHDNGKIHMKEFEDYCYTLPDPSWKAEKLRRTCVAALDHLSSAAALFGGATSDEQTEPPRKDEETKDKKVENSKKQGVLTTTRTTLTQKKPLPAFTAGATMLMTSKPMKPQPKNLKKVVPINGGVHTKMTKAHTIRSAEGREKRQHLAANARSLILKTFRR